MGQITIKGDNSPTGILRHWERKTKSECAREILRCWQKIEHLETQLKQAQGREVVLLTVCQVVQRDLLLRAEPDWDGSGQQVVNLSAGFWDELNRVIGKYDDTACKSFDALILRKQAEAVEALLSDLPKGNAFYIRAQNEAQRLRQQADELDAEQAGGNQCQ